MVAVSFLGDEPYKRDVEPDFGLYLDPKWDPPWPHAHVMWPDFGVVDGRELAGYLQDLLVRVRKDARVEIGCLGGHGRTGTALGCMAILTGTPRHQAVDWVRANYCSRAIETPEQQAFVESFGR